MSTADAPRKLPKAILVRLADLRRHLDALRHAITGFGDDFELELFAAASASDEPDELVRAYAVANGLTILRTSSPAAGPATSS